MANVKITDLTAYTDPASTDVLPIVDVGADVTKKVSIADLLKNASAGTAAAPGIAFDGDSDTGIYRPGANQVAISTNGTGALFVASDGSVGVGTATINTLLHAKASSDSSGTPIIGLSPTTTSNIQGGLGCIAGGELQVIGTNQTTFYTSSTERLRITSNGRLGLGTSSPGALLSLYAGADNEYFRGGGNGATGRDLIFSATTGTNGGDTHTLNASSVTGQLILSTAGTPRMLINSSGNVGIGTTNPTQKLQITDGSLSNFYIAPGYDGGTGTTIGVGGGEYLAFNGAPFTAERMRIDSSGRLLVGTSTARNNFYPSGSEAPQFQLETTSINTRYISVVSSAADIPGGGLLLGKQRSGSIGGNTIVNTGDELGQIGFMGCDGNRLLAGARIQSFVDGAPGSNDMPGRLVFSTTPDGLSTPTERMRIDSSGRVGIGTTAPAHKLTVSTGVDTDAGNITIGLGSVTAGATRQATITKNTTSPFEFTLASSNGGTNAATIFKISGSNEAARITSNGRLGLGTSSPSNLLDVNGTAVATTIGVRNTSPTASLHVVGSTTGQSTSAAYNAVRIVGSSSAAPNGGGLTLGGYWNNADVNGRSAFIQSSQGIDAGSTARNLLLNPVGGNVGIGTTSPSQKLSVEESGDTYALVKRTASGSESTILVGAESGKTVIYSRDNTTGGRSLEFAIGTSPAARIDTSGRLLVGTSTAPTAATTLVLKGNSGSSTTQGRIHLQRSAFPGDGDYLGDIIFMDTSDGLAGSIGVARDGGTWTAGSSTPGCLVFSTTANGAGSPTERMRITSDAYVRLAAGSGGIQFNGDTAAANALDDYEEGTWTPTIAGSTTAGAGSYANRVGRYTKIGNTVFFKAYIIWSAHTGTGNLLLTGLPFTSDATSGTFSSAQLASVSDLTLSANNIALGGYIANNSTQCNFTQTPVGGGTATAIGFDASGNIILSGYYTV